ncbi:MAG TPA: glycosyltransferase family 2 protein [Candidatus Hydrogenedentes bacterium]|nr:glycosyltransferase family 2 protein [Candidatus Hydrogenedentota bacterium]HPG70179.1 glycosyltransferase family 2 protein [Candidatus Hydrogenedentota bacterium]
MPRVTLITPCYNEEEVIEEFYTRVCRVADGNRPYEFEFLFVNDGSTDATGALLDGWAAQDPRVKVVHLARNRGHQIALTAGMDFASGDIIVMLDADLQDPPETVPTLIERIDEGYDIVHTQRLSRKGETRFKRATARLFYLILGRFSKEPLIENSGDFRAFTRRVLLVARTFREPHRYLRGLFPGFGFRQAVVSYHRDERKAGKTAYSLARMVALALDGVLSASTALLKGVLWIACILWLISLAFLLRACIGHFILHRTVPGWTSLVVLLTFFTGLNLFSLSVIGMYVSRIFEQGQHRPLYWCRRVENIDTTALTANAEIPVEVGLSARLVAMGQDASRAAPPQH